MKAASSFRVLVSEPMRYLNRVLHSHKSWMRLPRPLGFTHYLVPIPSQFLDHDLSSLTPYIHYVAHVDSYLLSHFFGNRDLVPPCNLRFQVRFPNPIGRIGL